MRLVAGTRPATTLAAKQAAIKAAKQAAIKAAKLAASSAGMPTPLRLLTRPYVCLYAPTSAYMPLRLLIVMTGLPDFCLLDF